jgi:uncharacterized protein YdeI (BOF family)
MKNRLIALAIALCSFHVSAEQYGEALGNASPIPVEKAIKSLADGASERVVVEGRVDSVCRIKGCWMGFRTDAGDVRVTFKDYAFFVPDTIVGKTVQVEGELQKVRLSLEESRHLVEDAGGDPALVTEPIVEYRLVARGVEVRS